MNSKHNQRSEKPNAYTNNTNNTSNSFGINKKFKNRVSRNPINLIIKIYKNLQQKSAFRSKGFWFTNVLILFICLKAFQLSRYLNEFSYFIPKEELQRNNLRFVRKELSQMEKQELIDYLDKLDRKKIERRNSKPQIFEGNNIDNMSSMVENINNSAKKNTHLINNKNNNNDSCNKI